MLLAKRPSGVVEIKGFGNDINIIFNEKAPFSEIESELFKRLEESNHFFSGTQVILDTGDRAFSSEEFRRINEILSDNFNLTVASVRSNSEVTQKVAGEMGWQIESESDEEAKGVKETKDTRILNEMVSDTVLIDGTIRSGQRKWHRGNIVVIGDINPGAEVVATGDIVVVGKLRGIAHAGADGDISARIIALDICPIQLRIANYIGRSPDLSPKTDNIPEVAKVEDGNIIIKKLGK